MSVSEELKQGLPSSSRLRSGLRCLRENIAAYLALLRRKPRPLVTTRQARLRLALWALTAIVLTACVMLLIDAWSIGASQRLPHWLISVLDQATDFGRLTWILIPTGGLLVLFAFLASPALPRISRGVLAASAVRLSFLFTTTDRARTTARRRQCGSFSVPPAGLEGRICEPALRSRHECLRSRGCNWGAVAAHAAFDVGLCGRDCAEPGSPYGAFSKRRARRRFLGNRRGAAGASLVCRTAARFLTVQQWNRPHASRPVLFTPDARCPPAVCLAHLSLEPASACVAASLVSSSRAFSMNSRASSTRADCTYISLASRASSMHSSA
jgi:hypothetical protein